VMKDYKLRPSRRILRNDVVHLFNVVAVHLVHFSPLFWDTYLFSFRKCGGQKGCPERYKMRGGWRLVRL
jgi:hypothetical protein